MRSNQNPSGSVTPSVGERSSGTRTPATGSAVGKLSVGKLNVGKLSMPRMPVEWLDSGSWRLPSGKALAEFALQAGFLAPLAVPRGPLWEETAGCFRIRGERGRSTGETVRQRGRR